MQDDTTNANVEEVEEQPQPSGQAPEPQEQEQQQQEETQGQETEEQLPEEQQEEETPPAPSRREQLRVAQLLERYGSPSARPQAPSQNSPNFRDRIDADEDTLREIEETAQRHGADQYTAGIQQAEFTTWRRFLQMDENQIRSKYEELNPSNKEKYHGTLETALQQKYLRFVGFDGGDPKQGRLPSVMYPDVSYSDFVEAEMEFSDELAAQRTQRTSQNIARQAASTGLRPDGSTPKRMDLSRSPEEMSNDELKAAISATMPRDARGRFTSNNR